MEPIRTQIVHVQPEPAIRRRESLNAKSFFSRLTEMMRNIGEKFCSQWRDPLSLELMEGCYIIAIDLAEVSENEEEFVQTARIQLIRLVNEVMIDTLFKQFDFNGKKLILKEPMLVLETKWTCEKEFITESNQENNLTLVTHDFAVAILDLASSLASPSENRALEGIDLGFKSTPGMYHLYKSLVKHNYAKFQLKSFLKKAEEDSEKLKIFEESIAKRVQEYIEKGEEAVEECPIEQEVLQKLR